MASTAARTVARASSPSSQAQARLRTRTSPGSALSVSPPFVCGDEGGPPRGPGVRRPPRRRARPPLPPWGVALVRFDPTAAGRAPPENSRLCSAGVDHVEPLEEAHRAEDAAGGALAGHDLEPAVGLAGAAVGVDERGE